MNKPEHSHFELKTPSKTFKLKEFQSPRGLRHEGNRPDVIVIDCYKVATKEQLEKHIQYLQTLNQAMK